MSGFVSGFKKFFTKDRVMILVIFILLSVFLLYYSTGKTTVMDGMDSAVSSTEKKEVDATLPQVAALAPVSSISTTGYSSQSVASPSELLPSDANSQWASLNPVNQSNPQLPDMLQAGYHIGLDTISSTMRNANLQIRSDPVIEKAVIGPWNQSTIEPDLMRVPLEVGS